MSESLVLDVKPVKQVAVAMSRAVDRIHEETRVSRATVVAACRVLRRHAGSGGVGGLPKEALKAIDAEVDAWLDGKRNQQ